MAEFEVERDEESENLSDEEKLNRDNIRHIQDQLKRGVHPDRIQVPLLHDDASLKTSALSYVAGKKNKDLVGELVKRGASELTDVIGPSLEDQGVMHAVLSNLGARADQKMSLPPEAAESVGTMKALGIPEFNFYEFALLAGVSEGQSNTDINSLRYLIERGKGEGHRLNPHLLNIILAGVQESGDEETARLLRNAGAMADASTQSKYQKILEDALAEKQDEEWRKGTIEIQLGCIGDRDFLLPGEKKQEPNSIIVEVDCSKPLSPKYRP